MTKYRDLAGNSQVVKSPCLRQSWNFQESCGVRIATMRRRWSLVLPLCGLALFLLGTYQGFRFTRRVYGNRPTHYFYWASIRLDSDPLNRHPVPESVAPCKNGEENCGSWESPYVWVEPGWGAKAFMLSALPAFAISAGIVRILARWGISEVATFFVSMPPQHIRLVLPDWLVFRSLATQPGAFPFSPAITVAVSPFRSLTGS